VIVSFFLAWLPITVVHFIPESIVNPADIATMKFSFVWMAIGVCSIKLLIFIFINREFRQYLCCAGRENDTSEDEDDPRPPPRSLLKKICCFCCPEKVPMPSNPPAVRHPRYTRNQTASNPQLRSFRSEFETPMRNSSIGSYNYYNGGSTSMMIPKHSSFSSGARYSNQQITGYGSITQLPPGF
jgi:hypothetical protein